VAVADYSHEALRWVLPHVDAVINTTSVGMSPKNDESPFPADLLSSRMVIMDIVYNPLETKLLKDARKKGCKTIDGIGMLVHQGAESLRIWLGIDAPVEDMKTAVMKELWKN
jgi:shikimate dehydrogenase